MSTLFLLTVSRTVKRVYFDALSSHVDYKQTPTSSLKCNEVDQLGLFKDYKLDKTLVGFQALPKKNYGGN